MEILYSAVLYYENISNQLEDKLERLISDGIITHVFTNLKKDEIKLSSDFLERAQKLRFLQFYYVECIYDSEGIIASDGIKRDNVLDLIFEDIDYTVSENEFIPGEAIFNVDQYKSIHDSVDSNIILKASAGTGKTTCMVDRIMYLKHVDGTIDFSQIGMITFTNKATVSMRKKIYDKISEYYEITSNPKYLMWTEEVEFMHISTLHLFAKKILDFNKLKFGRKHDIQIRSYKMKRRVLIEKYINLYLRQKNERRISRVYTLLNRMPFYILVKAIEKVDEKLHSYSLSPVINNIHYGNENAEYDELCFGNLCEFVLLNVEKELSELKSQSVFFEVYDLINLTNLFSDRIIPDSNFEFLFVDEFQDTDIEQVKFIVKVIKASSIKTFVVGDSKQSIYRFRGASGNSFDVLMALLNNIPFSSYNLKVNYRTDYRIINKINKIFETVSEEGISNIYSKEDSMVSTIYKEKSVGDITRIKMNSPKEIGKNLLKIFEELDDDESLTVLLRNNLDVMAIGEICEELNIPYEGLTSGGFFRTTPVKELLILIEYLIAPNEENNIIRLYQSSYMSSTENVINDYICNNELIKEKVKMAFHEYINKYRYDSPIKIIEQIIEVMKPEKKYYEKMIHKYRDVNVEVGFLKYKTIEYKLNLEKCLFYLKEEFSHACSIFQIHEYLTVNINTNTEIDPEKYTNDFKGTKYKIIRGMTVHKSKGLEFENVLLPYTSKKMLSNHKGIVDVNIHRESVESIRVSYELRLGKNDTVANKYYHEIREENQKIALDEEIRLLYVALTRTATNIIVQSSKASLWGDYTWENIISRGYSNDN